MAQTTSRDVIENDAIPFATAASARTGLLDPPTRLVADAPMIWAGQPCEMAPCYVFLASSDASYMLGQCLHPNGGMDMSS